METSESIMHIMHQIVSYLVFETKILINTYFHRKFIRFVKQMIKGIYHQIYIFKYFRYPLCLIYDEKLEGGQTRRVVCARRTCAACLFCLRSYFQFYSYIPQEPLCKNQTSRKSCSAPALLRAEQWPCEPSKDFVSKFAEQ